MKKEVGFNKNYIKFNLTDLPSNEFTVLLKPKIQKKLVYNAVSKIAKQNGNWGKYKQLAIYLHKRCKSFKNIKLSSLGDNYLFNWQNSKMYIPIDCILELYGLINKKLKEKDILFVKYKICHNKYGIKFPFIYDENLAFLGEAIRVEGHIRKNFNQINISNKNLIFLRKIKNIVKKYVNENFIYENLSIELDIPKGKFAIKVSENNKSLNFRIYKAARSDKIKLGFYDKSDNLNKEYTITFLDNSKIYVKIKEENGKLISKSTYKVVSSILNLSICSITFTKLLNLLLKIPAGKKSNTIFIPDILKNSPQNVKIEAINAVLDSESWVSKIIEKRVGIGLNSRKYLIELKNIFNEVGINAYIRKKDGYLYITGVKDLENLYKLFKFTSKTKTQRLIQILDSYKRRILRWNEGLYEVLSYLRLHDKSDAYNIATIYNKYHDTIRGHLNKGVRRELIEKDINCWPYKYSLTQKGLNFLESSK